MNEFKTQAPLSDMEPVQREIHKMLPTLWLAELAAPRQLAAGEITQAEADELLRAIELAEAGATLYDPAWWPDVDLGVLDDPKRWPDLVRELKSRAQQVGANPQGVINAKILFRVEVESHAATSVALFDQKFGQPVEIPSWNLEAYVDPHLALCFGLRDSFDGLLDFYKAIQTPYAVMAEAMAGIHASLKDVAETSDELEKSAKLAVITGTYVGTYDVQDIIEQATAYLDSPDSAPGFAAACESFLARREAELEEDEPDCSIDYAARAAEFDRLAARHEATKAIGYDPDFLPEIIFRFL